MNTTISNLSHYSLFTFIFFIFTFESSFASEFKDSEGTHSHYPEWFNDNPFNDLEEGIKNARKEGKLGLMVLFTTQGCSYCTVFIKKSLGDPAIASIVKNNFHSLGLEIFDDVNMTDPRGRNMPIKKFAKREKAEFSPTLIFYGEKGKRLLRVSGYQSPERFKKMLNYLTSKHYRIETFRAHLQHRDVKDILVQPAGLLNQDRIFEKSPYMLQRNHIHASTPLLVIFEERKNPDCAEFHSKVLSLKTVRNTLSKFEVVRLDSSDTTTPIITPRGKRTTPASWFKQTDFSRLPALVFFDEKGNNVLETDSLVLGQRMMNSLNFVIEKAYKKNWTYQQFARAKGIERRNNNK